MPEIVVAALKNNLRLTTWRFFRANHVNSDWAMLNTLIDLFQAIFVIIDYLRENNGRIIISWPSNIWFILQGRI